MEGRVSPGQLPEGFVHLLSVEASPPCDVHRPAAAGLLPPQSTGVPEGFWGESGTARPPAPAKTGSSELPSPFSAVASVKGHVFGPSSSASTLAEVRHQVSRHALVLCRCLQPLPEELSAQPGPGSPPEPPPEPHCHLRLWLACLHQPRNVLVGLTGPREIPAPNERMSKDLWSRGIRGTSHSTSSDARGHSSFQLMEDRRHQGVPSTGEQGATVIFCQASQQSGTWGKRRFLTLVQVQE